MFTRIHILFGFWRITEIYFHVHWSIIFAVSVWLLISMILLPQNARVTRFIKAFSNFLYMLAPHVWILWDKCGALSYVSWRCSCLFISLIFDFRVDTLQEFSLLLWWRLCFLFVSLIIILQSDPNYFLGLFVSPIVKIIC